MSIKSYFENKLSSQMAFTDEAELKNNNNNNKQIDFDKEFNFHDLKDIYDESSKAFLLKSSLNKPMKILKSASNVKVDSIDSSIHDDDLIKTNPQLYEKYFVVKDAALILPKRSNTLNTSTTSLSSTCSDKAQKTDELMNQANNDSTALLTEKDSSSIDNRSLCRYQQRMEQKQKELDASHLEENMEENKKLEEIVALDIDLEQSGDILIHLKSMIRLLRPIDTITVAVKLCSYYPNIVRYLVVVETPSSRPNTEFSCEESAILGNYKTFY